MSTIVKVSREEAPALRHLLDGFPPGAERMFLDPDEPVEWALLQQAEDPGLGSLEDLTGQLRRELDRCGEDEDALCARLPLRVFTPTAGTWRAWWEYLLDWIPEVWADPVLDPAADGGPPLPRVSRFTDRETADAAVTQVLRSHERRLREWATGPGEPRRLHLYAELGRDVGVVMIRNRSRGSAPSLAARACAVTLSREPVSGRPLVAAAYPELDLPVSPRQRYPDLPLLFGAYFGQDHDGLDGHRWRAEWRFNTRATPQLRDRVADQLRALLAEDDAELRLDVEALGSYVLPDQPRRWVTGLLRRLTVPDWSLPVGFIDPVTH